MRQIQLSRMTCIREYSNFAQSFFELSILEALLQRGTLICIMAAYEYIISVLISCLALRTFITQISNNSLIR